MDPGIEKICGLSDYILDFEAIGNNPNFVFEKDPNFLSVKLYSIDGSVIDTNSWIECANYVNGGWLASPSDFLNLERNLFFILSFITVVYFGIKIFLNRRTT